MGIFDKIIRVVKQNVKRNVERKVEQEVVSAVNKQFTGGGASGPAPRINDEAGRCGEEQNSGPEEQCDGGKSRVLKQFALPPAPPETELNLYTPFIRAESRKIAEMRFYMAQAAAAGSERRENYYMAAAHGHIGAMYLLGMIYYGEYENCPGDDTFKSMIVSFEDAALYNHVPSLEMLGYLYACAGDFEDAKLWLEKAQSFNSTYAKELLEKLI